jgi:hypothetical protein
MHRLDHAELDAGDGLRSALVHSRDLFDAVGRAVKGELEDRHDRRAAAAGHRDAVVSEVVEVAVRRGDNVEPAVLEARGEFRVVRHPGVDRDANAPGRFDQERRVAEPGDVAGESLHGSLRCHPKRREGSLLVGRRSDSSSPRFSE